MDIVLIEQRNVPAEKGILPRALSESLSPLALCNNEPRPLQMQPGWCGNLQKEQILVAGSEIGARETWLGALRSTEEQSIGLPSVADLRGESIPGEYERAPPQAALARASLEVDDAVPPPSMGEKTAGGRLCRKRVPSIRAQEGLKRTEIGVETGSTKSPPAKKARAHAALKAKAGLKKPSSSSKEGGCMEAPNEFPKAPPARRRQPAQKASLIAPKGHMQGSTPSRLRSAGGGVEVMAKMYFHRKKLAWRAEVLINGTKRQKSFSCKLYGYERARMLCEWARNFVLRTGRLPTDEETCASLAVLLEAPLPSEQRGPLTLDIQQWLHCYPPETPKLPCQPPMGGNGAGLDLPGRNEHGLEGRETLMEFQTAQTKDVQHAQHPQEQEKLWEPLCQAHTTTSISQPIPCQYMFPQGAAQIASLVKAETPVYFQDSAAVDGPYACSGNSMAPTEVLLFCRSLKEQEAALNSVFPELACLPKLAKPKVKIKRQKVGKKPHSGVRGMYFQQGTWKVNYQGEKEEKSKFFPYPHGNFQQMKQQHLLARIFLRQVIQKNRQLNDDDGDGLSDEDPDWLRRANVGTLALSPEPISPTGANHGSTSSRGSPPQPNSHRRATAAGVQRLSETPFATSESVGGHGCSNAKNHKEMKQHELLQDLFRPGLAASPLQPVQIEIQSEEPQGERPHELFEGLELFHRVPVALTASPALSEDEQHTASRTHEAEQRESLDMPSTTPDGEAFHDSKATTPIHPTPNSAEIFSVDGPVDGEHRFKAAFTHWGPGFAPTYGRNCWTLPPYPQASGSKIEGYEEKELRRRQSPSIWQLNACPSVQPLLGIRASSNLPTHAEVGDTSRYEEHGWALAAFARVNEGGPAFPSFNYEEDEACKDSRGKEFAFYCGSAVRSSSLFALPLLTYDAVHLHLHSFHSSASSNVDLSPTELLDQGQLALTDTQRPLHRSSGYKQSKAFLSSMGKK